MIILVTLFCTNILSLTGAGRLKAVAVDYVKVHSLAPPVKRISGSARKDLCLWSYSPSVNVLS